MGLDLMSNQKMAAHGKAAVGGPVPWIGRGEGGGGARRSAGGHHTVTCLASITGCRA